jgi:peroxin-6
MLTISSRRNSYGEVRSNEVVFFKVTNMEYDVMPRPNSSVEDVYSGSTLGELGCWVDTSITRMVQAGVEHSRVPSVCSYMNIG